MGFENQVESLIPRNFRQLQCDATRDPRLHNDIETADVGKETKNVLDVAILEVQADQFTGVGSLLGSDGCTFEVAQEGAASVQSGVVSCGGVGKSGTDEPSGSSDKALCATTATGAR